MTTDDPITDNGTLVANGAPIVKKPVQKLPPRGRVLKQADANKAKRAAPVRPTRTRNIKTKDEAKLGVVRWLIRRSN